MPPGRRSRLARYIDQVRHGKGLGAAFARGSIWALLTNGAGAGVAFLVQLALARAMGEGPYGQYSLVIGWMTWGALAARFQLDGCAARFVSEYRATGRTRLLRGFVRWSHQLVTWASVGVGLFGLGVVWLFGEKIGGQIDRAAIAAAALLLPTALIQLSSACLQGFKKIVASQVPNQLVRPLLLGISVWLLSNVGGSGVSAAWAMTFNTGATIIALVATVVILRRVVRATVGTETPEYDRRGWTRTALGFAGITASQQALTPTTGLLFVGMLLAPTFSAYYNAAVQLTLLVLFGANAVSVMGAPMIAQLWAENRRADLQRLMRHYMRLSMAVSLPVLLVLAFGGSFLLGLYGEPFRVAYPALLVMSVSQLIVATVGTQAGYLLTMTGREGEAGRVTGASALFNVSLAIVLTPRFGMTGTAIATLLATLVRAIFLVRYIRREMGIVVLPWGAGINAAAATRGSGDDEHR
jgi:O-antigen/teichoic acid export membrane protein